MFGEPISLDGVDIIEVGHTERISHFLGALSRMLDDELRAKISEDFYSVYKSPVIVNSALYPNPSPKPPQELLCGNMDLNQLWKWAA